MHAFLRFLSRQRWSAGASAGATIGAMLLITLIRLVAPLNTAPFLLYLPVIFVLSLALGWRPGLLGLLLSDLLAAYFFVRDAHHVVLTSGQVVALAEYVVVGAVTVSVCDALRRAIIESESRLADLVESRAYLEAAKQEAEDAKSAAEAANRAKSAFLANMSHELRTPLSAVIGYSEMLEEEAEDAGQAVMLADLGKIKSNAKHLLHLINDVLDLSKVEANKMDVHAETVDVAAFLRDVAGTVDALVRKKSNTLAFDLGQDLGLISTDVTKLRQCLFNLIGNAAKFTEAGRITLGASRQARPDGAWLSFTVADTGIGMTPDQLARLFQRFVQADESTTRKYGGTGLGLALSKAFAKLLGGDIAVRSTAGEGTCFTVCVPAKMPEHTPGAADEEDGPARQDSDENESSLVVVIDDEAAQRELTTRFLRRQGFAVQTASDGLAGLELVRTHKPQVVLLDVMMPGMDGWTVLKTLKEDPETASIPVVMVSFVVDPALGTSLGADATVPKPVNWEELHGVLDRFHGSAGKVLIVDDDADMHLRLRSALERNGWQVADAYNGAEALEHVERSRPELILLDLTMPVMDGFAFLHRLRVMPGCADIPVVVLSARDIAGSERSELEAADKVLRKDRTSMRDLTTEIRRLVTRRPQLHE